MANATIKKRINDYLDTEKTGEGKKLSKGSRDNLSDFFSELVFQEVKKAQETVPMKATLPEADASVVHRLPHRIGEELYYVIFKQVRSQVKGSLQVKFGWQFTVLFGKAEEIQIRNDSGILYKINGDMVLSDLVFKKEADAVARCNELNAGTDSFTVEKADRDQPKVTHCARCDALIKVEEAVTLDGEEGLFCLDCSDKIQTEKEEAEAAKVKEADDGKESESIESAGTEEVGSDTEGKVDRA